MRLRRQACLITILSIVSVLVMPILGQQSSSQSISSKGTVVYPEHELGVWFAPNDASIPDDTKWVISMWPDYLPPRNDIKTILNWVAVHPPGNKFYTNQDIQKVENDLKTIPTNNFWGLLFINEEHYKSEIAFNDNVDTTWFGESLVSYSLYRQGHTGASEDDWKNEMMLRMVRGFYSHFHGKTQVGITVSGLMLLPDQEKNYYGWPALNFIRSNYDFVFHYIYTTNLGHFEDRTQRVFQRSDELFSKQKRFWILTRIWSWSENTWEREAIALEMKNCLDRDMVVTTYHSTWGTPPRPPLDEMWSDMKKCVILYNDDEPYFEEYVYGENLLTGYVGNTYGWVKVT